MNSYATAVVQLPLVREAQRTRLKTPEEVAQFCDDLRDLAQEAFHIVTLNAKNHVIDRHMVTVGIADAALVHPREVFKRACHDGASTLLVVHNHPSGDVTPSTEDIRITRQLTAAGKVLDIKVLDHVIIAGNSQDPNKRPFLSMREEGLCSFE